MHLRCVTSRDKRKKKLEAVLIADKRITFIGSGMMAEAMIAGLLNKGLTTPEKVTAAGPRKERAEELISKLKINALTDNINAVSDADIVVLSVKPQKVDSILAELRNSLNPESFILSIIAGASIQQIKNGLNHDMVVRSMPNTPAQIGEGITVWTVSSSVPDTQKELAREILAALGEEILVEEEYYLDMATALSGTGPAYVFLFMEAMVDAGVHLGFPRRIAEELVAQTVRGSVDYFTRRDDPVHLARLRNQVTSPGGTSAAALYYLEKAGFRTALSRAIWAAYERSRDLGTGQKTQPPENS